MLSHSGPERPWYLEGRTATGARWALPVDKNPFVVGRNDRCDLSLVDQTVSRRHAEISYRGEQVRVQDLRSTNGTFVNDTRVKGSAPLASGDTVCFGALKFAIVSREHRSLEATAGTMHLDGPPPKNGFTDYYDLTRRQEDVLRLLLQGKSTRDIAEDLCVSFGTAKNHVSNIFAKAGVHSRFELIAVFNNFVARR